MKRSYAAAASAFAFVVVCLLGFKALEIHAETREAERARAMMPDFELLQPVPIGKWAPRSPQDGLSTVFVFFTTWCTYCQVEIQALVHDHTRLEDANIVLVSNEEIGALSAFGRSMRLGGLDHVSIRQDTGAVLARRFRIRSVPTAFVYNASGRLVGSFESLTPAKWIAEAAGLTP